MKKLAFSKQFLRYWEKMKPIFKDTRTWKHAREMAVSCIVADGPKTITNMILFNKKYGNPMINHDNWSSSYKMLSTGKWDMEALSWKLLEIALSFLKKDDILYVAVDDTLLNKTGRCIPECAYARDPKSPPFRTNLVWGQRILCASVLIRSSARSAYRAVPICFQSSPSVKIPSKATPEEKSKLVELKKKLKMSVVARDFIDKLRSHLDAIGQAKRKLLVCGDGSFANRSFMESPPHDTAMICRCRSDLAIFRPLNDDEKIGKMLYGEKLPTPAELAKDSNVPHKSFECGVQHQHAQIKYKSMQNVRWKSTLKNQNCTVFVIKGQYYQKYGKRQHTSPVHLVATGNISICENTQISNTEITAEKLLEVYLLRWEIEVSFRNQKNWFGIGNAQVWNENSVKRTPAFISACYAILLMTSMKVFDDQRTDDFGKLPKWRNIAPLRPSIRDLVNLLKKEVQAMKHIA